VTAPDGETGALRAVGRSALILTGATVSVQVVGIGRELFVASQIGLSSRLDALLIAMTLPTSVVSLLTSGMVTALVPAYLATREAEGPIGARRLAGAVLVWVGLGGALLSVVLAVFAGVAVAITGPGLSPTDRASASGYLFVLAPLALVASVSSILYAVCQAEQRFSSIAASSLLGALVTLAIVVFGWSTLDLGALAIGSLVGPCVALLVLFGSTVRGSVVPRLGLRPKEIDVGSLLRHAAPLTAGAAILQINVMVDRAIATLLAPGAVSALRFAEVLIRTPITAINPAWGSAIYPTLVHVAQGRESGSLARMTDRMLGFSMAAFVPIAVLTVAAAPVAVAVAYGRGAFSVADLALTSAVAAGFAPMILILMTSPVVRLALNARRLGRILLTGAIVNVILNTIFDVVLGFTLGVAGVALSSSLTAGAVAVYFARQLASIEPAFALRPIARNLGLSFLASVPGAVPVAALAWTGTYPAGTLPGLLTLGLFGVFGLGSYIALARWLGLEEPRTLLRVLSRPLSGIRGRRSEGA
jgi:putative peptidoglycan lipid II flippase